MIQKQKFMSQWAIDAAETKMFTKCVIMLSVKSKYIHQ